MRKKPSCLLCPKPRAKGSIFCPTCIQKYDLSNHRSKGAQDENRAVPEFAVYRGHVAKIIPDLRTGRWGIVRSSVPVDRLPKTRHWMVLDLNKWVDLDSKIVKRLKARIQSMYEPKMKVVKV